MDDVGEGSTRIRVRIDADTLRTAKENGKRYKLGPIEYLRIIMGTPAPMNATWQEIGVEMERRLEEARKTKEAQHGSI